MVYIAVEGCAHGQLNLIYDSLAQLEAVQGIKVDLLIICGDFQATRNVDDLECMAVPPKYRALGDFPDYYSGARAAPVLTVFIGGNHEASNHLWELYYGGWVAPNIYFLGVGGVVRFGGLRIAGLSGIYKHGHHTMNYIEKVPYDRDTERSVYHMRTFEVSKMRLLRPCGLDIVVTHDWPLGVTSHGDLEALLQDKPFFKDDIKANRLGNPLTRDLLGHAQPRYWFAGHLHAKFAAIVPHADTGVETRFLALDKPIPRRHFLQIMKIEPRGGSGDHTRPSTLRLEYDPEWLAVVRLTHVVLPNAPFRSLGIHKADVLREMEWVSNNISREKMFVPYNFEAEVPAGTVTSQRSSERFLSCDNPQTRAFLELLQLPTNPFKRGGVLGVNQPTSVGPSAQTVLSSATEIVEKLEQKMKTLEEGAPLSMSEAQANVLSRAFPSAGPSTGTAQTKSGSGAEIDDDDDDDCMVFSCACQGDCTCGAMK
eukprot:PhM_4_TR11936/c0_g1_i1/m.75886/K18328/DBR1; lariat debranching enzyme